MKKLLNSQKISKNPSANDLNQQKTLFQCWKSNSNVNTNKQETKTSNTSVDTSSYFNQSNFKPSLNADIRNEIISINDDNEDDEDLELIQATETFLKSHNETSTYFSNNSFKKPLDTTSNLDDDNSNDKLTIGIGDDVIKMTQFYDTTGFDFNSGSIWIYPNNMPIRSYQYNIVEQCLFKNTMVVLPTGLGKTFVAAVVMYNFYRWYPFGKVIFMAPTKPLVNQQSDACYKIVGIPKSEMCSMTGQMAPEKRKSLWNEKRVFFLTPQVIENDILRGTIDVNSIKCVVIDEAHKALGEYAFCKVIESINEVNKNFRIIALTATPGSDIKAVQNVINKLLISHIELRSDESIDIQQYNNHREVNKFVLTLNDEILKIRNVFYNVMRSPLKRLEMNRVLSCKDPGSLHKILILDRREQFRKNMSAGMDQRKSSLIECDLALLVTLIHALELLTQYGVKSFYMFLKSFIENIDGSKSASQQAKLRTEINNNSEMANYYELFKETFDTKEKPVPKSLRHPKLLKLEEVILDHFKNFNKSDTRVMIFSQYRESVYEITEMLSEHTEIKPMEFVGQSSGQNSRKTVTQKEQLEVVKKFRDGGYNTLVSTCVGEEGLDIGEVDLIICYDSQKSPIRLIQRMGRTGRKREGKIVILLTEGKEENSYKTSLSKKKNIYKVILNGQKNFQFYPNNPLMIPKGLKPKCHKMFIHVPKEEDEKDTTKINKKKEKSKKSDEVNNEDKKTKKTGKNSLKTKKKSDLSDSSFTSQNLPELNFDLSPTTTATNPNKLSTNKKKDVSKIVNEKSRPAFESQLKLFNDSNFLNLSRKQTSSSLFNSSTHKYVSDPPNFKKLFKCLSKKPKENETNIDDLSATFNLSECIKLWQSDEDDFMLFNNDLTGDVNIGNKTCEQNLNESGLVDKFSKFYIQLTNDLSESEDDLEQLVEHQPDSVSNQMIIDDTYSENQTNQNLESDKAIKEPSLNDLFMNCEDDEDDDDDLKYLNDANFNSCVQNYCINETINEENVKFPIINKGLTNLIKEEIKNESSPIVTKTTNSTSTPRSILKKNSKYQENNQETDNNNKISYSPLSYSPMCDNEKNNTTANTPRRNLEVSFENKTQNQSMIGMTQAIDLINATSNMTPYNVNKKSPILNENMNKKNSPVIVNLFDMKSNLDDLFNDDETDKENSISYSSINKEESIECIDLDNNNLNLINKARKLRFDEASILETSCVKPVKNNKDSNNDDDDDDCFFIKKKKASKDLSSSFSSQSTNKKEQKNYSDDSEFDELIGNNNLNNNTQNIGQHYYYHEINDDNNDEENENEDDDDFEQDFKRGKSKKKNKKSNFIIEEADLSGDDSGDSENDYEDDYDLKDSFVDNNEYSCNESMYLRYRESLNDVKQRPTYLNRKLAPITDDIFSQMPTQDSTYIHDSFCVPDDHVSIYEKKKSKKSKKSKKNADIKKNDKFKRIKNFNMTCVDEDETNSILSDDKQQIQEDTDSFKMTQLPKKKKKIQDSFSDEKSDQTDELDDEELFIIESNLMKAKNNKDYNKSLMIIEPEKKTKTDCDKNEVKSEVNFEVNMVEDDEDDDFNQWLINDTFSESNLKPAICENDQFNSKNETILNENKIFLSKFNSVQNTVKKETQIIKKENNTTEINTPPPELPKNTNWLIVDASLLTSAADVIKHIRKLWQQDKIIIQTGICCDFIIGQRCAAIRLKWSELSSVSNKDQIIEKFAKVKCLYPHVIVMIQDDRENNRGRTKLFDSVLANMAKITQILFSRYKTDEIVQQLYYLSKNEQQLSFDIDLDCNRLLEKRKKEISFYLTLPNISIINALYLCKNYENINKFCNSSLEDLKTKGKMNDRKARKLLKFLIDS